MAKKSILGVLKYNRADFDENMHLQHLAGVRRERTTCAMCADNLALSTA